MQVCWRQMSYEPDAGAQIHIDLKVSVHLFVLLKRRLFPREGRYLGIRDHSSRQDGPGLSSKVVWRLILCLSSGSVRQPWISRVASLSIPFPVSLPCWLSDVIGGPQAEHRMETLYCPMPKTSILVSQIPHSSF